MNRTRYRLPAIMILSAVAVIVLHNSVPEWIWFALTAGVLASAAEIARHYGDFSRIARDWSLSE